MTTAAQQRKSCREMYFGPYTSVVLREQQSIEVCVSEPYELCVYGRTQTVSRAKALEKRVAGRQPNGSHMSNAEDDLVVSR
jgi:hypothetical protein